MVKLSASAFLLLLSAANDHGSFWVQAEQLVDQIFGGENVRIDEFEWFTSVRSAESGAFVCSGFLVGKSHVMTAAHCVENFSSSQQLEVEVGYFCRNWNNCRRDRDNVGVQRWDSHEDGGDMAILTLDNPVSIDIRPAVPYLGPSFHPKQNYMRNKKKGRKMQLVGAGRVGLGQGRSFFVQKTQVVFLPENVCKSQVDPSLVTSHVICSLPSNGNPCEGDSGAAVVVPGKEQFAGRDVVMAVHFKGRRNCDSAEASNQPILHFPLEEAAAQIRRVICGGNGDTREDWCPVELRGDLLHILTGHSSPIAAGGLSFNSNGSRILSASSDGTNKIWDPVAGGAALATFANGDRVWAGRFHPRANYFASGSDDGAVRLWKPDAPDAPFQLFTSHSAGVDDVTWSPCGTMLASASGLADMTIKVWSVVGDELLATLTGHSGVVRSVSFHPDGTQLASASADGTIKVWNATSFELLQTLTHHGDEVWSVSYSPDGKFLASGSNDKRAILSNVKTGKLWHDFREHTDTVGDVAWGPNGRLVATASNDRTVRVWDAWNGGSARLVLQHTNSVSAVAWSPDGTLLASGLWPPGNIILWRITRD